MKPSQLFSHWNQIRRDLLSTIEKFDDDELGYRPVENGWSVGQIALHIGEAEEGWFRYVVTGELEGWPEYRPEDYPSQPAIISLLTEIHGRTQAYLDTLVAADLERKINAPWGATFALGWIIWHVLEHEIHHRSELSLTLGLLGREGLDV